MTPRPVRAAVVVAPGAAFVVEDLELGAPRPDEVVVRIAATGVCHTDLVARGRGVGGFPGPVVLGHEGAGVVEDAGAEVTGVAPGDHVLLSFASCGACRRCRAGHPAYCEHFFALNLSGRRRDGSTALRRGSEPVGSHFIGQSSFASHAVVPASAVVKVERDLPLEVAAPLGCGLQTGAGAVLNALPVGPGSSFAVFGTGAVGLAAVMAAAVAGAGPIIGVDRHRHRLDLAAELGATRTVLVGDGEPATPPGDLAGTVDVALDTTGAPAVLRTALDWLPPGGVLGLVASSGDEATFGYRALLNGRTVTGIIAGDAVPQEFLPRLLDLWRGGRFPFDRLVAHFPFAAVEAAAAAASAGSVIKPVLVMD